MTRPRRDDATRRDGANHRAKPDAMATPRLPATAKKMENPLGFSGTQRDDALVATQHPQEPAMTPETLKTLIKSVAADLKGA